MPVGAPRMAAGSPQGSRHAPPRERETVAGRYDTLASGREVCGGAGAPRLPATGRFGRRHSSISRALNRAAALHRTGGGPAGGNRWPIHRRVLAELGQFGGASLQDQRNSARVVGPDRDEIWAAARPFGGARITMAQQLETLFTMSSGLRRVSRRDASAR